MIAIVNFSARTAGNCAAIARELRNLHPDEETIILPVGQIHLSPCCACQYECFAQPDACPHVADDLIGLYRQILHSRLTYFILPNYAGAPPAAYFAFNERSQCVFQGNEPLLNEYLAVPKRFIFVSNQTSAVFDELPMYHTAEGSSIRQLYLAPRRYSPSSIDATMMDAPAARQALADFVRECEANPTA